MVNFQRVIYIESELLCRGRCTMMRRYTRSRRFSSLNDGVQNSRETSLLWLSSLLVLDQGAGLISTDTYCLDTTYFQQILTIFLKRYAKGMYWIQPCENGAEDHGVPPNQELQVAYPSLLQFIVSHQYSLHLSLFKSNMTTQ